MPLPLQSKIRSVEFVAFGRIHPDGRRHGRLTVGQYGIAATVTVLILAHHRPVVFPRHGFEPSHTAVASFILKVHEPIFSGCGLHPTALMGSVDRSIPLLHDATRLVRPVHVAAAGGHLPSHLHATGRKHQVIITVAFIKLRSLGRVVHIIISVIYDAGRTDYFRALRVHFGHTQHGIDLCTASGPRVSQITLSVIVPQRTGVDNAFGSLDQHRLRPFAGGVFCLDHIHAEVRVAPIDIVLPVMVTDARCPYAFAMLNGSVKVRRNQLLQSIVHHFPIHQVLGVEDGQAGHTGETGSRQIKIIPHGTDIGVGIIRMNHRILVHAIAQIGRPYC